MTFLAASYSVAPFDEGATELSCCLSPRRPATAGKACEEGECHDKASEASSTHFPSHGSPLVLHFRPGT